MQLSRDLHGQSLFPQLYFLLFPFWEPDTQGLGCSKTTTYVEEFRNHRACPGESAGSEKSYEEPKFTPQADRWYRDSLQQSQIETKTQNCKHWGRGKNRISSYHIIILKCSVFNNNKIKSHTKKV